MEQCLDLLGFYTLPQSDAEKNIEDCVLWGEMFHKWFSVHNDIIHFYQNLNTVHKKLCFGSLESMSISNEHICLFGQNLLVIPVDMFSEEKKNQFNKLIEHTDFRLLFVYFDINLFDPQEWCAHTLRHKDIVAIDATCWRASALVAFTWVLRMVSLYNESLSILIQQNLHHSTLDCLQEHSQKTSLNSLFDLESAYSSDLETNTSTLFDLLERQRLANLEKKNSEQAHI